MPTALVTGGSRGIGEATSIELARRGYDVAISYREKQARADKVVQNIKALGRSAFAVGGDITSPRIRAGLADELREWAIDGLDALVLNASGGLEQDLLAQRPEYAVLMNRDAQEGMVRTFWRQMKPGSTVAYITSHWAHLYGEGIEQLPSYEPIARSKFLGQAALMNLEPHMAAGGVRLLVVTGDLVEGTITAKMLERNQPGLAEERRQAGSSITVENMGIAIANSIEDKTLQSGSRIVVGAPLDTLL
jgi:NADP-dependent 3-hydroxy acid dehydrogenase YdfG